MLADGPRDSDPHRCSKPPVGSALLWYNFGPGWGGRRCEYKTLHRSNPVTRGIKVVLQRWHTYAEQPFLAARPMMMPEDRAGRLPFQAMVSCDFVRNELVNVSCRRYNDDVLAQHR